MAEIKVTVFCPKCHQEGVISSGLLGSEVDCPSCKERFMALGSRNDLVMSKCPHCGSDKIIPDVPLLDCYGEAGGFSAQAEVEVQGAPRAWVFKDPTRGQVSLSICGECGYAAVRVSNAHVLWAKYQRAQRH